VLGYWLPSTALVSARARRRYGVAATIASARGVTLTFDDGPHPEGTPAVLEALGGVKATFFLVGEQAERYPELVARIRAEGHAVGVHCHRHRNLLRVRPDAVREDFERAADAIGGEPTVYRPPYGILNATALAEARRRGWNVLLWSLDGRDWRRSATPDSVATRIVGSMREGDVVLLHDSDAYGASWRNCAGALPHILGAL
jgi:peptidoglycan/xylan/chitin deacetylase (PgdA/CDA1 family)